MGLQLKEYYNRHGIRSINQLVSPIISDISSLSLPRNSAYHFMPNNDNDLVPESKYSFLRSTKRIPIINITELQSTLGNYRRNNKNLSYYNGGLRRNHKEYMYYNKGDIISSDINTPYVYNYTWLNIFYTYYTNRLNRYNQHRNNYITVMKNIKELQTIQNRYHYLIVEIPTTLPTKSILYRHKHIVDGSVNLLNDFQTTAELNVLELFRWIDPKTHSISAFGGLTHKEYGKINLILKCVSKWYVINLGILFKLIKDNNIYYKYGSSSYVNIEKFFLSSLINLKNGNTASILDNDTEEKAPLTIDEDSDDININSGLMESTIIDSVKETEDDLVRIADSNIDYLDTEEISKTILIKEESIFDDKLDVSDLKIIKDIVDLSTAEGLINGNDNKNLINVIESQDTMESPYKDGNKLKDMLVIDNDELILNKEQYKVPDDDTIPDKSMLYAPIEGLDKTYIKEIYKKDVLRSIYSMQLSGNIIQEHNIDVNKNYLGEYEEHTLKIKPLNGKVSTIRFRLPTLDESGIIKISGNEYLLRKQRNDKPIRKIKFNRVGLTSYYSKIFIDKANYKKNDIGYYIKNKLSLMYSSDNSGISNLILTPVYQVDIHVPNHYSIMSRYVKAFNLNDYYFNFSYNERANMGINKPLDKLENNGRVLIGKDNKNNPIVIDKDNKLYLIKDKEELIPDLFELLEIDKRKAPIEYALMRIFNKHIPLVLVLGYYVGIENLLVELKTKYKEIEGNKRYKLEKDEYIIKFKDKKLVFNKNDELSTMIIASFKAIEKQLTEYNFVDLNNRDIYISILTDLNIPSVYINEIDLLYTMFIDPITLGVLESMGEPTNFKRLLIRAAELLITDYTSKQQDLNDMLVKGYERIPGLLYKTLTNAIRDHKLKTVYGKTTINLDPFSVWKDIGSDSALSLVDDLNPVAELKLKEDVTYLGHGGRNKETMNKDSREYHINDIGVISEATKDSGDVGISASMSANPNIKTLRGDKNTDSKIEAANILSTSALLAPGGTMDDPKRTNFINIQNSHSIPIMGQEAPWVQTGYERVLPYRASSKFTIMATKPGIVEKVNKKEIIVKCDDGEIINIKLRAWSSKIESGIAYKNIIVTDHKVGDKIENGDYIAYNPFYFTQDIFNKKRLVYMTGKYIKVMMEETVVTHEDSCAISSELSKDLTSRIYKVKSYIVDFNKEILNMVSIGQDVNVDTTLFSLVDSQLSTNNVLDSKSLEILQYASGQSPVSKVNGKIDKINVIYNGEISDMSDSLQKLAQLSDKQLQSEGYDYTGKVTNEYSIKGKPLLANTLEIKIFVEVHEHAGTGDKVVLANQMKSTIGETYDYPMKTEDGNKIDMKFGERSIQARIVHSPKIIGTTATVLDLIQKRAIAEYYK